jgi:hypothetical protein
MFLRKNQNKKPIMRSGKYGMTPVKLQSEFPELRIPLYKEKGNRISEL